MIYDIVKSTYFHAVHVSELFFRRIARRSFEKEKASCAEYFVPGFN